MSAGRYDITAYQGSTVSRVFTYRDSNGVAVNLTSYTARMDVRAGLWPADGQKPAGADGVPTLDADTMITLGGAAGTITLLIPAVSMVMAAGDYVYDLELQSPSGVVTILLEGSFTVRPNVTRS